MSVVTAYVNIKSKGRTDIIDITNKVQEELLKTRLDKGCVTIFVSGSTGGITTVEYEPALVSDLKRILEKLIPSDVSYAHDATWGDANGYSHLRSSLLGTSFSVPFADKRLCLGTWQQIIFLDFDNRPRNRRILLQFMGE